MQRIDMAATIIYLVISLLVSLIFILLGIKQYKAEKPVTINTGEKPPREDELTSVTLLIVIVAEIAWVEFEHNMMKKKMIKNRH